MRITELLARSRAALAAGLAGFLLAILAYGAWAVISTPTVNTGQQLTRALWNTMKADLDSLDSRLTGLDSRVTGLESNAITAFSPIEAPASLSLGRHDFCALKFIYTDTDANWAGCDMDYDAGTGFWTPRAERSDSDANARCGAWCMDL